MSLTNKDKNYIQTRLIRIMDAKDEICLRIKKIMIARSAHLML